ncbi:relaxase/mobilization nuclease [Clostridium sp. AF19-22AC]|uniref:relaxase/mobilization nuclease domain-containing protein n=1 Tax=Clostridia TaxID=186801 RepID=UPI000E4D95D2|nr:MULTISPECIES: relaxase/mobilization nuclease domain-containing protein [Clostridia]RHR25773.1 relaxase/mobilization nuclease [Clostridium sp. AF19-22AC]
MAYTSIIPVHRLDNSIEYIKDKEKTTRKLDTAGSLEGAVAYALNREKTELTLFEDAIGCTCENAYADMAATKSRFHKTGGVQGYHLIQSFSAGEVSPELAHLIGQELAEQLLKGQFEVVITTHLNTSHYHNHLVFNSVSMVDGHKYHSNSRSYYEEIRRISDGLCRKYGLSVIQTADGKGMSYAQWKAEQEGKPTWRTGIRMDIREAVQDSFTWKQFVYRMEEKGYEWKLDRKYVAVKAPGMERFVRLKSLGENYTETSIQERILQPKKKHREPTGKTIFQRKKYSGLQALYYSYLYRMGIFQKRPRRTSFQVQADIRKLDQRIEQMEFLQKHDITTLEQLRTYCQPLEERMLQLTKERHRLYRADPDAERIQEITEELKPLRREVKMCRKIEQHSLEIEGRLQEIQKMEEQAGQEHKTGRTEEPKKKER